MNIAFVGYLNWSEVERILAASYRESLRSTQVHFDLSKVKWVGPMALSILWCWMREVRRRGIKVAITQPAVPGMAVKYLNTVGFSIQCQFAGYELRGAGGTGGMAYGKVAAFECFQQRTDVEAFVGRLTDQHHRAALLHAQELPEIVLTGDFAGILAQELGENTFVHAGGVNSHLIAFESESAETDYRLRHPLFADFGGAPYIEIAVGDSGASNLIRTMSGIKGSYDPMKHYDLRSRRPGREKVAILRAFEYGATSNPVARQQKIDRLFANVEASGATPPNVTEIGTGLYSNLALVRHFGGQIIVRAGGIAANIDCSGPATDSDRPRVTFLERTQETELVDLPGTLLVIRVPVKRDRSRRSVGARLRLDFAEGKVECLGLPYPDLGPLAQSAARILRSYEQQIEELRQRHERRNDILVGCSLDGIGDSNMGICYLLFMLARVPRGKLGLLVTVARSEVLNFIRDHWQKMKDREFRHPSLVVCDPDGQAVAAYGSESDPDATTTDGKQVRLPAGVAIDLRTALVQSRQSVIGDLLRRPGVRHTDGLFFIEGKYYTRKFYEIGKLAERQHSQMVVCLWLRDMLENLRPTVIIHGSRHVRNWIETALSLAHIPRPELMVEADGDDVPQALFRINTTIRENRRVVIICDVICSSRFIIQFIRSYRDLDHVSVLAFVEARADPGPYFGTTQDNRAAQVTPVGIVKEVIEAFPQRPQDFGHVNVYHVDKHTLKPRLLNTWPKEDARDAERLLKIVADHGAISAGHYRRSGRDFVYALNLPDTFTAWAADIRKWLHETETKKYWDTYPNAVRPIRVYCLEGPTGLDKLVYAALGGGEQWDVRLLKLTDLRSPPRPNEKDFVQSVWFVLPGIAAGSTAQNCFEYAAAVNGAAYVHVSAIFSRMEANTLRFYRRITRYGGKTEVSLNVMVHFAIPAYGRNVCPICQMNEKVRWVRHTLPAALAEEKLLGNLEEKLAEFGDNHFRREDYPVAPKDADLAAEMQTVSLFTMGEGLLNGGGDQRGIELLARAIGRVALAEEYQPTALAGAIASRQESIAQACRHWPWQQEATPADFRRKLRGFWCLAPDALRARLPEMLHRIAAHPGLLRVVLEEALLFPNSYWYALPEIQGFLTPADHKLTIEVIHHTRGFGADRGPMPLVTLHWMRVQIVRSSGWTAGRSLLMASLTDRTFDPNALHLRWQTFKQHGYEVVMQLHRQVLASVHGQQLQMAYKQMGGDPTVEIKSQVDVLDQMIEAGPVDAIRFRQGVTALRMLAKRLRQGIDRIACLPWRPLLSVRRRQNFAEIPVIQNLAVLVHPECTRVAIFHEDLERCFNEILTNAAKYAPNDRARIEFRPVSGTPGRLQIQYFQETPWFTRPNHEHLGLKQIEEIMRTYQSIFTVNQQARAGDPMFTLIFHCWPLDPGEGEEHSTL